MRPGSSKSLPTTAAETGALTTVSSAESIKEALALLIGNDQEQLKASEKAVHASKTWDQFQPDNTEVADLPYSQLPSASADNIKQSISRPLSVGPTVIAMSANAQFDELESRTGIPKKDLIEMMVSQNPNLSGKMLMETLNQVIPAQKQPAAVSPEKTIAPAA